MTTWDLFTGCAFNCYNGRCWAKLQVEGRLKHLARYKDGFVPTVHPDRFKPHFKPGEFVFVVSKGDISFAPREVCDAVNAAIHGFPETKFLVQSKEPRTFTRIEPHSNVYFGTTLETNRNYGLSQAGEPWWRYQRMLIDTRGHRFISIEPIIDFDMDIFLGWLQEIKPEIVQVGADNYHAGLPEPSWDKVQQLLAGLRKFVPLVVEKEGLGRLRR